MGMYDIIVIKCRNCGKEINSQTKVLGDNEMRLLKIGTTILNENFSNCILKLKSRCGCGVNNAIIIKNKKIIEVESPFYANVTEELWGQYKFDDELQKIVKAKLRKIKNQKNDRRICSF